LVAIGTDGLYGDVWTAGQRANISDYTSPFVWRVLTANGLTELPIRYQHWQPGEHRSSSYAGQCLVLARSESYDWANDDCGYSRAAVCEIDVSWKLLHWPQSFIIAHQHTDARYWYSNSVRPSVRNAPVSDENGLTYWHIKRHVFYGPRCIIIWQFCNDVNRESFTITFYWLTSQWICCNSTVTIVEMSIVVWSRVAEITVWMVVQTVLTATFNSYGDGQISTPYKINTPEPIDKKFGTLDYVKGRTLYTKFGTNHPLRASGQMGEI